MISSRRLILSHGCLLRNQVVFWWSNNINGGRTTTPAAADGGGAPTTTHSAIVRWISRRPLLPDNIISTIERLSADYKSVVIKQREGDDNDNEPAEPQVPIRIQFGQAHSTPNQIDRNEIILKFSRRNWQRMVDLFRKEHQHYGLVNLATTLTKLAKFTTVSAPHNTALFHQMFEKTLHCMGTSMINARNYGTIIEAIAKLKAVPVVSGAVKKKPNDDNIDDNDNDAPAAPPPAAAAAPPSTADATTTTPPPWPYSAAALRIVNYLSDPIFCHDFLSTKLDTHAIGDVCWSVTELQRPDLLQTLLQEMDAACLTRLITNEEKGMPHLAKFMYACGSLGQSTPVLVAAIEQHADWLLNHGTPKAIAYTAWACGRLGHTAPTLFAAIERRAEWFITNGNPGDLSNTVWAIATLGHASTPHLLAGIASRYDYMRNRGTYKEFKNTQWAFAQLGHPFIEPIIADDADLPPGAKPPRRPFRPSRIAFK
jgi:hypothetical protein